MSSEHVKNVATRFRESSKHWEVPWGTNPNWLKWTDFFHTFQGILRKIPWKNEGENQFFENLFFHDSKYFQKF